MQVGIQLHFEKHKDQGWDLEITLSRDPNCGLQQNHLGSLKMLN